MEGYCLTGESPQWAVVPMEEEEEEEEEAIFTYAHFQLGLPYIFQTSTQKSETF